MKKIIILLLISTSGMLFKNNTLSTPNNVSTNNVSATPDDDVDYSSLFQNVGYPNIGDIPILNRKIFRGIRVTIKEHPYIVSIRRKYSHYLTGTLINTKNIISVAHPLVNVSIEELGIVVGENYADRGTFMQTVVLVVIHEDFDIFTLVGDIALLKVFEEIQYRFAVKSIPIVSSAMDINGKIAFVTGWGRCDLHGDELCLPRSSVFYRNERLDPMLRTINFKVEFSNKYCDEYKRRDTSLQHGMLCLGIARTEVPSCPCLAVPGAPLVIGARLAGILSWGLGCGFKHDLPLIYTDIKMYRAWIMHNTFILRRITEKDLSLFYKATKSYYYKQLLQATRKIVGLKKTELDLEFQEMELDVTLSKLQGTVYDIRDFISNGLYHETKNNLYELLKTKNEFQTYVYKNIIREKLKAFLGNETLDENGLKIDNGTLKVVENGEVDELG